MKNCLRKLLCQLNPAGKGRAGHSCRFRFIFAVLAAGLLVCRAEDPNGVFVKPIPAKTVVLTFDDGTLSHYTNVAPLLQSLGFTGTFFYSENWLGNSYYMTLNQVSNLNAMGFEVGNHTVNHWDMGAVTLSTCRSIVVTLDNDLAANGMTNRPTTLAYPLGHVNSAYYSGLYSLGYLFARSTVTAPYRPTVDNPFNVPCYGISDSNPGDFYNALTNATTNQIVVILFHGVPDQQNPNVSTSPTNFAPMMQHLKTNNYNVIAMRDLAKYVGRISAAITNTPVTDCTSTSAVLHATFRCAGLTNYVYACWNATNGGTNPNLWTNSAFVGAWTNIGSAKYAYAGGTNWVDNGTWTNMAPTNLSLTASGLMPNTTYFYTFCVSNDWGRVWAGNVRSFCLGSPTVNNVGGATNLAAGGTQLQGALSNGVADVYFYWGTADGGTSPVNWANTAMLANVNPGAFAGTINLSNQLYGLTYYYRCFASNSLGTAWAPATTSFTITKPVAPPPVITNASFESPSLTAGTKSSRPASASWNFLGGSDAGITAIDWAQFYGGFVPEGNQAGYLYGNNSTCTLSQSLAFAKPGTYTVSFWAISRESSSPPLNVQVDGADVGWLYPGQLKSYNWGSFTSAPFSVSAGIHTLSFVQTNTTGGGGIAVDNVQLQGGGVLITLTNAPATGYSGPNATSATLNATLSCTGSVYNVYAYWNPVRGGTNAALWTNSAYVGTWTNQTSANLSYTVTGLATNTQYFYTFRATNVNDDLWATNILYFGLSTAKDILSFGIPSVPQTLAIVGTNITWTVPYSTSLTSLAPTYTVSEFATASPVSGTSRNFSTPQTYTITAQNGSTQTYRVTANNAPASPAKDVLAFSFPALTNGITVAMVGTNINVVVPYATVLTALSPAYTVSPLAAGAPASGVSRDFTTPQNYTITAEDGSTKIYVVTVARDLTPTANPQSVTLLQNLAKAITLTGSDPRSLSLTYAIVTSPTNGTLTGTPPNVTYTPASGYTGADNFTFKVNNGVTNSPAALVALTVLATRPSVYYWTNGTNASFSSADSWTNNLLAASALETNGQPFYRLNLNKAGTFIATNDLTDGFMLNQLNFGGATVTLVGNGLTFVNDAAQPPQINQNATVAVIVTNNLVLSNNLTFGGTSSGNVTLQGLISGPGSLTKNGSGKLLINARAVTYFGNTNTYSGGTILNSGTLQLDNPGGLTTAFLGSGPVTVNGGTLDFERVGSNTGGDKNPLIFNGGILYVGNGFGSTWGGPVTLNTNVSMSAYASLTITNVVSGGGGLTWTGGTLSLSASNSYLGPTVIKAGTLNCNNSGALGNFSLSVSNGALVGLNYTGTRFIGALTLGGTNMPPGTYGWTNSSAATKDVHFTGTGAGTLTVSARISITNTPASGVTATGAVLNATLGCATTNAAVLAYWNTANGGSTPSLWTNSAYLGWWTNLPTTNQNRAVSNLTPATTYYFTFRTTNLAYDVWASNVQSFTTPAPPLPPTPVLPASGVAVSNGVPSFTFSAAAGFKYRLNYKNVLTDSGWILGPWSTNSAGTAQPMTLIDPDSAVQLQRFYRLEAAYP